MIFLENLCTNSYLRFFPTNKLFLRQDLALKDLDLSQIFKKNSLEKPSDKHLQIRKQRYPNPDIEK